MSEPNVIVLGQTRARKLAALHYLTQGAKVAAEAAVAQHHNALHRKWQEAVEDAGASGTDVQHDVDAGTLTVTPAPS